MLKQQMHSMHNLKGRITDMEKKIFEQAEIEVVKFLSEDFVTMSSPFDGENDQIQ